MVKRQAEMAVMQLCLFLHFAVCAAVPGKPEHLAVIKPITTAHTCVGLCCPEEGREVEPLTALLLLLLQRHLKFQLAHSDTPFSSFFSHLPSPLPLNSNLIKAVD